MRIPVLVGTSCLVGACCLIAALLAHADTSVHESVHESVGQSSDTGPAVEKVSTRAQSTREAGREESESQPPISADALPWLEILAPSEAGRVGGSIPLVEVRGRAGTRARNAVDVVLAFDLSESTLYPSGIDVDSDGVLGGLHARGVRNAFGTLRPSRFWTTDPDDTIVSAELEAARRLLRRLETAHTRVGLVSFAGRARELQEIGSVQDSLTRLSSVKAHLDSSGTNLGSAVRAALRMLDRSGRDLGSGRRQVVIVLSDGRPTVPAPAIHARTYALSAGQRAREAGVRIYAYALGPQPDGPTVLEELAGLTGGEYVAVEHVGDVVNDLPYIDFGGIRSVEISNRTTEQSGRAVRLFGDGSFDGFIPLAPGENLIEVSVRSEADVRLRTLRSVYFDEQAAPAMSDAYLARILRERTYETEMAAELRAARTRRDRKVEIRTESAQDRVRP